MSAHWQLGRRTFLRGMGTAMALPLLEAMQPSRLLGAAPAAEAPRRMAFLYIPNGADMRHWTPHKDGTEFDLPMILSPLESMRRDVLVLSGLAHDKANSNGDGGGDHARSVATFLTGCQARKTHGKDIRAGVSVDQVVALEIGKQTRFASLELGCERGKMAGNCDSGYSCVYSSNMSWRTPTQPMPKEVNPRSVFDRLFGNGDSKQMQQAASLRDKYQKSILDFALEDAQRLKQRLGQTDRRKVDEYLESVRSIEQRINRSGDEQAIDIEEQELGMQRPKGVPGDYGEHVRLMGDLMVLAFQLDLTRICTFMLANAGSNRTFPQIGVREAHHGLSHHGNNKAKMDKIAKINRYQMEQFAYILEKMKSVKEGASTLLDHSMIVYGSGIGDGNRHNHDDLPILLAGGGGGSVSPGRHVRYPKGTPLTNLFLSMLDRVGAKVDALGDSSGRLSSLTT